ncbi:MAG: hypothetical protein ACAH21_12635 [Ramlibacter sp.]|nr:hypothetical protein [Ramlibacter sp.]
MANATAQIHSFEGAPPTAVLVDATAFWLASDDDLALGCECAYPSLQIERWGQEAPAFTQHAA